MKKIIILSIILIALMFLIGIYFYPKLPEKLASHWDENGNINGYMSKPLGLFFLPILTLILVLILIFIPKLDPLKQNIKSFQIHYFGFIIIFEIFMLYIYILSILANLNYKFNLLIFMLPAFSILFFLAGLLMIKSKRNWFIGLRTPWTLSNDIVWNKSNKLAGILFQISAVINLLGLIFQNFAIWLLLIPIIISAIISVIYSYLIFKKLKR